MRKLALLLLTASLLASPLRADENSLAGIADEFETLGNRLSSEARRLQKEGKLLDSEVCGMAAMLARASMYRTLNVQRENRAASNEESLRGLRQRLDSLRTKLSKCEARDI